MHICVCLLPRPLPFPAANHSTRHLHVHVHRRGRMDIGRAFGSVHTRVCVSVRARALAGCVCVLLRAFGGVCVRVYAFPCVRVRLRACVHVHSYMRICSACKYVYVCVSLCVYVCACAAYVWHCTYVRTSEWQASVQLVQIHACVRSGARAGGQARRRVGVVERNRCL